MFKKILPSSEFGKNVSTLVAGTAIAQCLTLLSTPVLSRLYDPEEFAVFALFTAASAIIGVVAAGRYELAIVLPEDDADGKALTKTAFRIVLFMAMITLGLTFAFDLAGGADITPLFSKWFYLLSVSVLSVGAYGVYNYWSTRIKSFRFNAYARVFTALVSVIISIYGGWAGWGFSGLILGLTVGQATGATILFFNYRSSSRNIPDHASHKRRELAKFHGDFPRINSPHALLDSIQDNGVIFVLTSFFTQTIIGLYSFSFRILKAPVGLIGAAFHQVFFQRLSAAYHRGENLQKEVLSVYIKLALIGLPGFFGLFLFTPEIFGFAFGEKWIDAGHITRILIPWLFLNFIVSPVSCVTLIYQKQKMAFTITIFDFCLRLMGLLVGGFLNDYMLGFILMSASSSLVMLFTLFWFYDLAGQKKAEA